MFRQKLQDLINHASLNNKLEVYEYLVALRNHLDRYGFGPEKRTSESEKETTDTLHGSNVRRP